MQIGIRAYTTGANLLRIWISKQFSDPPQALVTWLSANPSWGEDGGLVAGREPLCWAKTPEAVPGELQASLPGVYTDYCFQPSQGFSASGLPRVSRRQLQTGGLEASCGLEGFCHGHIFIFLFIGIQKCKLTVSTVKTRQNCTFSIVCSSLEQPKDSSTEKSVCLFCTGCYLAGFPVWTRRPSA